MAGLIPLGTIARPGEDIFPTTGSHLDVRVIPQFGKSKGQKINPRTARSLLQNILVGQNKTPLVQQQGDDWKWNFPVTSEYGNRNAPVAGASTFHQGLDIGLEGGSQLAYRGYGAYTPGEGLGTLRTYDPQGNPYDIQFLHTKPGQKAEILQATQPSSPGATQPAQPAPKEKEEGYTTKDALQYALFQNILNASRQPSAVNQMMGELFQGYLG